jgi:hypothetical protein
VSGTDIFLSYARHDRSTAQLFAESLVAEGFSVWWDASLHSGETFDEVIERNLRDAKAVVVLWSPRSVASRWVRAEATLADRRDKMAPAIIEDCDLPIIFGLKHAADLSEWTGDPNDIHWRTFMDDLRRMVDAESQHQIAPAARPAAKAKVPHARPVEERPDRAPSARRPLRPGNEEIIQTGRVHPMPSPPQSPIEELLSANVEADAAAEVHCLEIEAGELDEALFVIESSGVKIGRTAPADIVLSHRSVSREHCIIGLANDELLVTDLNSTNGTYVDDARISRATVLPVGSVLRVGQIALVHSIRTQSEAEDGRLGHASSVGSLQTGRLAAAS